MTQDRVGMLGLGAYVPERIMTNQEWAEYVDTSDEWITSRTGIQTRHIAADHESTADLAVAAAQSALDDAHLMPTDIDEIVVATDTPEFYIPDTASFVQHRLRAREVPAYDLGGSGCAGFILGMDIARSRAREGGRRILVVGVELITRLINWRDRNVAVLFGDAAGAAVIGCHPDAVEILPAVAGTDGTNVDILHLETGGTHTPFTVERAKRGLHKNLVMQGRAVFKEAVKRMTAASREVLANVGLAVADVSLVVPHQANLRIIEAVRSDLGLSPERVFVNVHEYGNTGSASVPLALWDARRQGRIASGDIVLLTAFGAGLHWAAMVLRF